MKDRKVFKKLCAALLILIVLANMPSLAVEANVGVSAQAAILMDTESGRILFEKNSDQQLRIASITKIMTAIIAIENGDLADKVETSRNAYRVEGSSIYLKLGEKLTLENMLYGLMLRSGNDAAVAIAEHIGGSVEGFVQLMNQKAQELGMSKTVFSNPHGLDTHEEHYSTARDMAVLTAYAIQNEEFAKIVATERRTAPLEGESWDRIWYNKNRMLSKYPYADGVKTGFTKRAHRTLVSSATKDGHRLVTVTLNAGDDWNDHISMFEYGFNNYKLTTLVEQGQKLTEQRLEREDGHFELMNEFAYPLSNDERVVRKISLHPSYEQTESDQYPFPAGYMYLYINEKEIGRVPIQFTSEENRQSWWSSFKTVVLKVLGGI
ncbi:D-alanyl-D-alanine carboxypeptidase family protein [Bacillus horti]|uniref:D-alanyl-D-alanine carboxypeptidase n=1 Tax=Caldalkalibacillus horti TaxID=77523 RepID=A0ABT9VU90_9BACI|nr:D-alanyl-D-alanine carboxypeptidase family protein [Bacillus horti]MDQ0164559.1 D-alanyl-D-alanine carboxypeptidase [Bacillus horti]